jgi:hypothetical protein
MLGTQLRRHLALLRPAWTGEHVAQAGATPARLLDGSALVVVTG